MDLMYPNVIDRLRAAHFILAAWRKKLYHKQQSLLAKDSEVDDGTVSAFIALGHLQDVALRKKGKILVTRDTALSILIRGLKRSQKDVDALLWLYYGEPFEPVDRDDMPFRPENFKDCPAIGPANQYTYADLHGHVVELLTDAQKIHIPDPIKNAQTQMIFDFNKNVGVASDQTLLNLENEDGQRLLVSKYPSYLTYPPDLYEDSQWRSSSVKLSEEGIQKHQELTGKRRQIFLEQLKKYGERSIHSQRNIMRYLQYGMKNSLLSAEQRISHIEHWIELIRTNNHYQVGLAEGEPDLDLVIKNTVGVFLTGPPADAPSQGKQEQEEKKQSTHYGPRYILWRDKESIFSFFVDFERNWAAIPEQWRNRENVINRLSEMVEEAKEHLRSQPE